MVVKKIFSPRLTFILGPLLVLLQIFRLHQWVSKYAVNLFYFDQWDFLSPLFKDESSVWELFRRQHGSHRMGVGLWVEYFVKRCLAWNGRSEAFLMEVILVLNLAVFLGLVYRLEKKFHWVDFFVGTLFLSVNQYEIFVGAPDLSHGLLTQTLMLLILLALTGNSFSRSRAFFVGVGLLMVSHTGFGFLFVFGALAASLYFLLRGYRSFTRKEKIFWLLTSISSAASLGLFYFNYVSIAATESGALEPRSLWKMLLFPFFALSRLWGAAKANVFFVFGLLVVILTAAALLQIHRKLKATEKFTEARDRVVIFAAFFMAFFLAALTVGRVQNGLGAAVASRYYPYLVMAWIPLYFSYRERWLNLSARGSLILLALIALLFSQEWRSRKPDSSMAEFYAHGKRAWGECYKKELNVALCTQQTGFDIHPNPDSAHLSEKLNYLKEKGLNLFAE